MNSLHALKFPFNEPQWWKKLLIPGLIALIPGLGIIYLMGWACEIARRFSFQETQKIPESFSLDYLSNGFKLAVSILVYYIPLIAFWLLKLGLSALFKALFAESAGGTIPRMISACFGGLCGIYSTLFFLVLPGILILFLKNFSIRDTLDFRQVYDLLRNNRREMLKLTAMLALLMILGTCGASFFVIGLTLTLPYAFAQCARVIGNSPLQQIVI